MYIPKTFEVTDSSTLYEFIETYSFGTLVTVAGEQPIATRLPLILDRAIGRPRDVARPRRARQSAMAIV